MLLIQLLHKSSSNFSTKYFHFNNILNRSSSSISAHDLKVSIVSIIIKIMKIIQTFETCENNKFSKYINTWKSLFTDYYCFNDYDINQHILEYCNTIDKKLCEVYSQLPSKINKIDIWRYVYIYMHGGLYVDVDIGAKDEIKSINFEEYDAVLFKESNDNVLLNIYNYYIGDHPRYYQIRQSIFYCKEFNPWLKKLIDSILTINPNHLMYSEPRFTFELTGPAIFTDIMKESNYYEISYIDSKKYIDYHSTGSWRIRFEPLILYITFLQYVILYLIFVIIYMKKK